MAKLALWIDWDEEGVEAGFQETVAIDLNQFQGDDRFAEDVSAYISRGLHYLAREVEGISLAQRRGDIANE